ncbi:MAG: DUF4038 domain-containing protein [Bacteroidales bacterium]|nr:DUF4038 domain-containing protein [Bacteroidales bacterium]
MKRFIFLAISVLYSFLIISQKTEFPIKPSENGRYLIEKNNRPFFYQAETPWKIFINLNEKEMAELMDIRINQGFTAIQTMALTTNTNVNGDKPFRNNDFSNPNTNYFEHIRNGIKLAEKKGLLVGLNVAWKGCCGRDWVDIITENGVDKCREYGKFLGKFFSECPNLYWIQGGDNDPREQIDHYRQIALGIRESIPNALQTYHASSGHSSSDVVNYVDNSWLNFSWTYTYFRKKHNVWVYLCGFGELPEVYEMNHNEYRKRPIKPFVLGESQYEGEDSSSYAPLSGAEVVRRQAYWSILSGSCGHAYGSWCWKVNDKWRNVKNDSGANQMLHVKNLFESIEWYKLIPDLNGEIITSGAGTYGNTDYAVAAFVPNGSLMVVYLPPTGINSRKIEIDVSKIKKLTKAQWYNPINGKFINIQLTNEMLKNKNTYKFSAPADNGSGSNDWILVLR